MHEPPPGSRRRHLILPVVAIKVAFVALVVLLPSGLAIGLGVAHGIAALVVLVALSAIVFVRRRSAHRAEERADTP
jgi:hypothetical protein